mmetsp:Transcript_853/g.2551  ORF Transcript_853/g.2551 Transcript_853/m.2551 type:complete len:364 (-) Transcript_853:15-1106(-)
MARVMSCISSWKRSSIVSNSSTTSSATESGLSAPRSPSAWSALPGVAETTTLQPLRTLSRSSAVSRCLPPYDRCTRTPWACRSMAVNALPVWTARSLFGDTTRMVDPGGLCESTRPRPPMAKAPVLPVPAGACSSTSRPATSAGMARRWHGVGCSKPISETPRRSRCGSPIWSKDSGSGSVSVFGSGWAVAAAGGATLSLAPAVIAAIAIAAGSTTLDGPEATTAGLEGRGTAIGGRTGSAGGDGATAGGAESHRVMRTGTVSETGPWPAVILASTSAASPGIASCHPAAIKADIMAGVSGATAGAAAALGGVVAAAMEGAVEGGATAAGGEGLERSRGVGFGAAALAAAMELHLGARGFVRV